MFKSKIFFIIVLAILLFSNALPLFAQQPKDTWITKSIDWTINAQFSKAESLLYARVSSGDSTAETWFFIASMLNSKMTHYEHQIDQAPFMEAIKQVQKKSNLLDKIISREDSTFQARQLFYRGSTSGFLAFFQGQNGDWYDALNNGLSSISDLEKAVSLDSTLYDAWLGIGVYQYWRSTRLKFLFWTPFVKDLRSQGIENIRKAVRKSKYSRYMAMHQLIYILLNYGAEDEALIYAQKVIKKYPNSVFMRWAYAHVWYMRHDYVKALTAYQQLLILLNSLPEQNPNHRVSCTARLAEMYQKTGQLKLAHLYAQNAAALAKHIKLSKEGRKGLDKAKRILQSGSR